MESLFMMRSKNWREFVCEQCGQPYTRYYQPRSANRFCGRACFREAEKQHKTHQRRRSNTEADFWARVDRSGGPSACWLWQGCFANKGYGYIHIDGRLRRTHRYSWQLAHGTLQDEDCVLHTCDTPACVNPAHLFLGTRADNAADKVHKGRQLKGTQIRGARLDEELVREARWLANVCLVSYTVLGRFYGVSEATIRDAAVGRTWAHVQ